MASQQNITEILSIDAIIVIYKYLDFEDQLRLSRVNAHLKIIFKSYVWKEEYTHLKVYKNPPNFVITNQKLENRIFLRPTEYQEFLRTYADEVRNITIENHTVDVEAINHDVNLNYFQNLLSFKYEQIIIPVDDVKVIAERNTNLQELKLKSYFNLYVTDELIECILLKMLNLKGLTIETGPHFDVTLSQFQEILRKSKLESLKLTAVIVWDESLKESEKAESLNEIGPNEFALHTTFDSEQWLSDFTSYLINFKSLTALTITLAGKVTHEMVATLAATCQCLKKMRFEYNRFSDVKIFRVPFSVMEFSLLSCSGLSYENLKQILSQYNITKFHSAYTSYKGEFVDFQISPLVESLHITNDLSTINFQSAYKANKNLKELTWWNHPSLPITYITPSFPLQHCINLHSLYILNCQMNLGTLLELSSLRRLEMPHPVPLLEWSFITQLLQQHSSLRQLVIRKYHGQRYRKMDSPAPHKGFATQVHTIELPFDILSMALDFWLDVFSKNKSLRLICSIYQPYERIGKAIKGIVTHKNFPKSMKTIDICGFRTDCKYIRNQYEAYLKTLQIQIENSEYWCEDAMYRISIYRT